MISVFEYTDYRKFLKDLYTEMKQGKKGFTLTYVAHKAGFASQGFMSQLFAGQSNLAKSSIPRLADVFKLKGRERSYFKNLVMYNQAKKHSDKKKHFKEMLRFHESPVAHIPADRFELFDKWYYSAIRAILDYYPFDGDYAALGKFINPTITASEAQKAIETLLRLNVLSQNIDGSFTLLDKNLSTGFPENTELLNNYVLNTLDISREALYRFEQCDRLFSAMATSISKEGYEQIRKETLEYKKRLVEIIKNDKGIDRVYQLNIQLFPLTHVDQIEELNDNQ